MHLESHFTLSRIEEEMRSKGLISKLAEFSAPDGTLYAKCSTVSDVMQLPFFRLNVDNNMTYNVHYKRPLRENISVMTPDERQFYEYARSFNVCDSKVRPLTKMSQYMMSRFAESNKKDKVWSHRELSFIMRDSIANQSLTANSDRDGLLN